MVGYGNECSVQECGQWWDRVMSVVYKSDQWWDMVMSVVYKSVISRGLG